MRDISSHHVHTQCDRFAKLGLLEYVPVLLKIGVKDESDLHKPELKDKLRAHLGEVEAAALCAKIEALER